MRILGKKYCGKERHEAFKGRNEYHDILCWSDYTEIIVSIFAQQIKFKYYGGNRYLSIEIIAIDHFSASTQSNSAVSDKDISCMSVFYSFFSDDSKQDTATTDAHSKHMLQLSQHRNKLHKTRSTI